MPTYDYRCQTCGVEFELFQSFTEDGLTKCPTKKSGNSPAGCTSAGRGKVSKVFSPPGIAFKGSGFYKTDSRSSGSKKKKAPTRSADSGSKSESSKSDSSKSDSSNSDSSKSTTAGSSDSSKKSEAPTSAS